MSKSIQAWVLLTVVVIAGSAVDRARGDVTNSLILSQANTVSGSRYVDSGKSDGQLGRLQGNGQNWLQFITTKTDDGKNTLDLRGYSVEWSYNKSGEVSLGNGVLKFSNDPVWAAVPLGTMIHINEWQKAWYLKDTAPNPPNPDGDPVGVGGMQRDGGINGLGTQKGTPYSGGNSNEDTDTETLRNYSSHPGWNPLAAAGPNMQAGPNWNINVWAGEGPLGNVGNEYFFKYFSVSGSVTTGTETVAVGTEDGGLFTANNDNWQWTIKDSQGATVQGPIGEAVSGGWGGGGVGAGEIIKIENTVLSNSPTIADWQNAPRNYYKDGSTSNYGGPSKWTQGADTASADLSPLRNWFNDIKPGDVNLDGIVNGQDVATLASHWLQSGPNVGWLAGDSNGDGIVNGQDIATLASHWLQTGGAPGAGLGSAAAVPEPATCVLLAMGVAMAVASRLRGRR